MATKINPFIISGYVSPEYFCDREQEKARLVKEISNGNNVALISPRRMGKTGLIKHSFGGEEFENHYTFYIDIYATKTLREFVFALSRAILVALKPRGKKALETFVSGLQSLKPSFTLDAMGNSTFNIQLGDIQHSETTMDEIFKYLESADKPCIVAIDEFQQIAYYPEKNVEAILRTYIQNCTNSQFIFAGSQRHMMGNIFLSPSRPFYQSVSITQLEAIDLQKYIDFATGHFEQRNKKIEPEVISGIYERFDKITWYIQKLLNTLFAMTPENGTCTTDMVPEAIDDILGTLQYSYSETMFRLPEKQKETLIAISKAGKAKNITSSEFIAKYGLTSASSVQAAVKVLLEKDYITLELGTYSLCDKFLALWIDQNY